MGDYAEAAIVLWDEKSWRALPERLEAMSLNVHNTHCCYHCGCKYGDPKCPVANGTEKAVYGCEFEADHNTDSKRLDFFEKHQQWFRYSSHPSMDGKYPCWIVWTPKYGTTQRKTLREAIDAAMEI